MSAESKIPPQIETQVSPQAKTDLLEIWVYLAERGENLAVATLNVKAITDKFVLLGKFPNLGRSRAADLSGNLRSFPVDSYVIFYRVLPEQVQILRVLHGSRDAHAIFAEE
jgi:toxin ParE1/3/4